MKIISLICVLFLLDLTLGVTKNRTYHGRVMAGKKPRKNGSSNPPLQDFEVQIFIDQTERETTSPKPPEPIASVMLSKGKVTLKGSDYEEQSSNKKTRRKKIGGRDSIQDILNSGGDLQQEDFGEDHHQHSDSHFGFRRPYRKRRKIYHHHVTYLEDNTVSMNAVVGILATIGIGLYLYQVYLILTENSSSNVVFARAFQLSSNSNMVDSDQVANNWEKWGQYETPIQKREDDGRGREFKTDGTKVELGGLHTFVTSLTRLTRFLWNTISSDERRLDSKNVKSRMKSREI